MSRDYPVPPKLGSDPTIPEHAARKGYVDLRQLLSQRGAASGYAPLDSNANVPSTNLYSASPTQTGIVRLTGDLGGTATAPTVPGLAGKSDTGHTHSYQPLDSDLTVIAGLTPADNDLMQWISGAWASRTGTQIKASLGLDQVNNTTDASKPISTATQAALDAKAATSHIHAVGPTRLVPATTRSNSASGPGSAATGLVTGAGATGYMLTELTPAVEGQTKIRLRYWNGRTVDGSPGEVAITNSVTLRASIRYPCGVWKQVSGSTAWNSGATYAAGDMVTSGGSTWVAVGPPITVGVAPSAGAQWRQVLLYLVSFPGQDANRRVTLAGGSSIDSDVVDLGTNLMTPGIDPYVGITTTLETGNAANVWKPGDDSGVGDFVVHYATTGAVPTPGSAGDPVDSGFATQTNAAAGTGMPVPSIVLAEVDATDAPPVLGFLGDSVMLGFGDPFIGLYGWPGRSSELFSVLRTAQNGGRSDHFLSNHAYRDTMLALCDAVVVGFGGNEVSNGQSLATMQSNLVGVWKALKALSVPRVWASTPTPITTSTDSFATVANQTALNGNFGTTGTNYALLLKWLRDGAVITQNGQFYRAGQSGHPLAGVLDLVPPVVDPTSPWKWRAPGYTSDGGHPSATGAQIIAAWVKSWFPTVVYGEIIRPLPDNALHHISGWTVLPQDATSAGPAMTGGTIYLAKFRWPGGNLYQLHTWVTTLGATLTSGQNLLGVYTLDGSRLGVTATQHTAWTTAGDKVAALVSPVWAPAGELYMAWLTVGTTRPVFAAGPALGAAPGVQNSNLPASVYRAATGLTGQTSLPTTMSMSALVGTTQVLYGAAS